MGLLDINGVRFALADAARREDVYRLRYNVWVEEMGHARPAHFPQGRVQDEFDAAAVHAVAFRGDAPVAAARLVPPGGRGLPIHGVINVHYTGRPEPTGEISHLVIDRSFRRRKEDGALGAEPYLRVSEGGVLPDQGPLGMILQGRKGPRLVLGLFRLLYRESKRIGVARWMCLADLKLFNLLNRYGMPFRQMADRPREFPDRVPSVMLISEFEDRLRRLDPSLFEEFEK